MMRETESGAFLQAKGHGRCSRPLDCGLVCGETRVRIDDLVALLAQRSDGGEDNRLAPWRAYNVPIIHSQSRPETAKVRSHSVTQSGGSSSCLIVCLSPSQRRDSSLNSVGRGIEVGITHLHVNDITPRAFERLCARNSLDCPLSPQ